MACNLFSNFVLVNLDWDLLPQVLVSKLSSVSCFFYMKQSENMECIARLSKPIFDNSLAHYSAGVYLFTFWSYMGILFCYYAKHSILWKKNASRIMCEDSFFLLFVREKSYPQITIIKAMAKSSRSQLCISRLGD